MRRVVLLLHFVIICTLFNSAPLYSQDEEEISVDSDEMSESDSSESTSDSADMSEGSNANQDSQRVKIFKDQFTTIKNPFELRDPFRRKSFRTSKRVGLGKDYKYSNYPELKPFTINQLKIVGIFFGKERRAVAKIGNSQETFILKEGDKVGDNNGEIKAIMPGGVVVVEKIRNVYDQEEILETIVPLSSANISN